MTEEHRIELKWHFDPDTETTEDVDVVAKELRDKGGEVEVREQQGILPLLPIVGAVIGISAAATVIADWWRRRNRAGVTVDLRDGKVEIKPNKDLEPGTVLLITDADDKGEIVRGPSVPDELDDFVKNLIAGQAAKS